MIANDDNPTPVLPPVGYYAAAGATLAAHYRPQPANWSPPQPLDEPPKYVFPLNIPLTVDASGRVQIDFSPSLFGQERQNLVQNILSQASHGPTRLIISATRTAGKSAFIYEVLSQARLNPDLKAFRISGHSTSSQEFYCDLCRDLGIPEIQHLSNPKAVFFERLNEQARQGQRVLLILDEASYIYQADPHFFDALNAMPYVSVLFLSFMEHELYRYHELISSDHQTPSRSALDGFDVMPLPPLGAAELADYISYSLFGSPEYGKDLSPEFVQLLLTLSNGNIVIVENLLWKLDRCKNLPVFDATLNITEILQSEKKSLEDLYHMADYIFSKRILDAYSRSDAQWANINAKETLEMIVQKALEFGRCSFAMDELFTEDFLNKVGITDQTLPIYRQLLDQFAMAGLIEFTFENGKKRIHITSFPFFMSVAPLVSEYFSQSQLIRFWNGEFLPEELVSKEN